MGEVIYMTVAADTAEADEAYFSFVGSRVGEAGDSTAWCVVYDLGHERELLGEEAGEETPEEMGEESGEESGESL